MKAVLACALLGAAPALTLAEVVGVDITTHTDVQNGAAFGDAGAYELLTGRIRFAIDPANARNQVVVDIDKAPRNAAGKVELMADLSILKPKDSAKANGTLLLDVVNRGNKTVLGSFNRAAPNDMGDGMLLRRGFTVVWVGWEFDVPPREGAVRIEVPAAKGVKGRVRATLTPTSSTPTATFTDLIRYAPADAAAESATLSVRDGALSLEMKEAEALKRNPGGELEKVQDCISSVVEDICHDINISIDYFENQYDKKVEEVYITGGASGTIGLQETLERTVQKPVQKWNPLQFLELELPRDSQQELEDNPAQAAIALGLASRVRRD